MAKHTFFKQLKVQIASYYLISSLIIVLIISTTYYFSTSSIILDDTLKQTLHDVEQSGKDIEGYLFEIKNTSMFIARNSEIINYLMYGAIKDKVESRKVIDQALSSISSLVSIVVIGKDGSVLSNETALEMSVSKDMMNEEWYVRAIDNQQMPALTSARLQAFTMDKDTWVIALSQEIVADGTNLGVVLLDMKYQVIENYLDHLPLGESGFAFIMDEKKQVVYHPDTQYFMDEQKKADLIAMVNNRQGYDPVNKILTHHYKIPNTNWTLVGVSSLDKLQVVKKQLTRVLLMLGFVIFLVVFGGSYFIAEKITKPIKRLQDAMGRFEEFNTALEIPASSYEVEQLTLQFKKMLNEIQRLLSEIKANEHYLRTYELNALYSQINPHFLYNTLDTIVWMAEFNNSDKVIEVTKSLAQFFRISLSKGQEMITLENEFDHISQYLFIQKQRYDDLLSYSINLPAPLRQIEVPKIILQPFVENAIYHGIREKSNGGHISVTCQASDQKLSIVIKDNGVGYKSNKNGKVSVKLGGVGIENVKKRLDLIYGDRSSVAIVSKANIGTTVTLVIPLKP